MGQNVSLRSGVLRTLISESNDAIGDWKYKDAPDMAIQAIVSSAKGTTATATATQAAGVINNVTVVNGGSFYNAPPVVTITGFSAGSGVDVTANLTGGIVTSFTINDGGSLYDSPITVTIAAPDLTIEATVDIQQCNDAIVPVVTSATFTMSGNTVVSDGAVITGPWKYIRAVVSSSTGTGVNTTVLGAV